MTLKDEIERAEAHLALLRQKESSATCAEVGRRWEHVGGRWTGGCPNCNCSSAIYTCSVCGDSDYGDPDAEVQKNDCARLRMAQESIGSTLAEARAALIVAEIERRSCGNCLEANNVGMCAVSGCVNFSKWRGGSNG